MYRRHLQVAIGLFLLSEMVPADCASGQAEPQLVQRNLRCATGTSPLPLKMMILKLIWRWCLRQTINRDIGLCDSRGRSGDRPSSETLDLRMVIAFGLF